MDGNQSPEVEWRPVKGWEGKYEVSNTGLVKSLARVSKRKDGHEFSLRERILWTRLNQLGYEVAGLSNPTLGIIVHRLVAEAFIPNPENKRTVNHKDCDKTNNHVSNLEWCTHLENIRHAYENGLYHNRVVRRGDEHSNRKLSTEIVLDIMKELQLGTLPRTLGEKYGVNRRTICAIKIGQIWSHVTGVQHNKRRRRQRQLKWETM